MGRHGGECGCGAKGWLLRVVGYIDVVHLVHAADDPGHEQRHQLEDRARAYA